MKFFIDTANLAQIREANEMGVLDGYGQLRRRYKNKLPFQRKTA